MEIHTEISKFLRNHTVIPSSPHQAPNISQVTTRESFDDPQIIVTIALSKEGVELSILGLQCLVLHLFLLFVDSGDGRIVPEHSQSEMTPKKKKPKIKNQNLNKSQKIT